MNPEPCLCGEFEERPDDGDRCVNCNGLGSDPYYEDDEETEEGNEHGNR